MNGFNPSVIIVVVVSMITTEMVWMAGTCNERALDECYSRLRQSTDFRQMEKNDTIFPTWNDSQLDLLCGAMARAKNCAINVTVHCSSSESQIYKGSDTAIFYLCGEGRQQYRNVRECFQKNAVRQSKSRCHGDYLEALDNLYRSTDRSHEEKVLEICRHIDRSTECIRQDIIRECGEAAAEWTASAMNHQQRPAKEKLRCHVLESQMEHLSSPVIFGIILLLLLATTVCIMTTLLVYRIFSNRSNHHHHHRLTLHHDIVKYNTTPLKGCGGSADGPIGCESGGRPGGGAGGAGGAGGRTFDHLTVPLMLSQSGLSATGKSAVSTEDNDTPSTAGDG